MLDGTLRKIIDPPLNAVGRMLARKGVQPNDVTLAGLALGLLAAAFIIFGLTWLALVPLALSRLADGLDGAVARARGVSDFGGYLDIVSDFVFYGAIPLAFVLQDPAANAVAGAFLLFTFYVNGTSFLGFAILAERRGMETRERGTKTLYFTGGLVEGSETIAFFVLFCLFPAWFSLLAWIFAVLCMITAVSRVALAHATFAEDPEETVEVRDAERSRDPEI